MIFLLSGGIPETWRPWRPTGLSLLPSAPINPAADIVPPAELAKLIAGDRGLRESLLRWAWGHTRHRQDAEDLYQATLLTALDPEKVSWDRARHATASGFLGSVLNGLARNRVRSSYMALRSELDEQNPPPVAAPVADPEAKLQLAHRERKRAAMEADLRARLADKPLPIAVLDWTTKGVKTNIELAQMIGCEVSQVVAAKQMLRQHAAIVRDERASEPGAA
jgi:hypothetical protein